MKRRMFLTQLGAGVGSMTSLPLLKRICGPETKGEANLPRDRRTGSMDSTVEINLANLAWNVAQIKKVVRVPIMAVIKANAYGHGLVEVAKFLEKQGIRWLMVGKLEEAIVLREKGVRCRILNFGAFSRQDVREIVSREIHQAVWSEEATFLDEEARARRKKAAIHIDVDTGMGRTGVPWTKVNLLLSRMANLEGLKVEGLMTTLTEDEDFDREQLRRLDEVYLQAKERGISIGLRHAASSAGILAGPEFHLDMVRPGIMLYGYYPSEKTQRADELGLKPVARWCSRVIDIRELQPGETLSYHRVYKATQTMRVATIGVGYSDGYPAQLAGKNHVLIKGKKFPLLAAVTANHMMVDLEGDQSVAVGDEAILLDNTPGSGLTADILASLSGTSSYKILIWLNPLLPRHSVYG